MIMLTSICSCLCQNAAWVSFTPASPSCGVRDYFISSLCWTSLLQGHPTTCCCLLPPSAGEPGRLSFCRRVNCFRSLCKHPETCCRADKSLSFIAQLPVADQGCRELCHRHVAGASRHCLFCHLSVCREQHETTVLPKQGKRLSVTWGVVVVLDEGCKAQRCCGRYLVSAEAQTWQEICA